MIAIVSALSGNNVLTLITITSSCSFAIFFPYKFGNAS